MAESIDTVTSPACQSVGADSRSEWSAVCIREGRRFFLLFLNEFLFSIPSLHPFSFINVANAVATGPGGCPPTCPWCQLGVHVRVCSLPMRCSPRSALLDSWHLHTCSPSLIVSGEAPKEGLWCSLRVAVMLKHLAHKTLCFLEGYSWGHTQWCQDLLLTLCTGLTHGSAQGSIWSARD